MKLKISDILLFILGLLIIYLVCRYNKKIRGGVYVEKYLEPNLDEKFTKIANRTRRKLENMNSPDLNIPTKSELESAIKPTKKEVYEEDDYFGNVDDDDDDDDDKTKIDVLYDEDHRLYHTLLITSKNSSEYDKLLREIGEIRRDILIYIYDSLIENMNNAYKNPNERFINKWYLKRNYYQ